MCVPVCLPCTSLPVSLSTYLPTSLTQTGIVMLCVPVCLPCTSLHVSLSAYLPTCFPDVVRTCLSAKYPSIFFHTCFTESHVMMTCLPVCLSCSCRHVCLPSYLPCQELCYDAVHCRLPTICNLAIADSLFDSPYQIGSSLQFWGSGFRVINLSNRESAIARESIVYPTTCLSTSPPLSLFYIRSYYILH
jgi:hypothetical protein